MVWYYEQAGSQAGPIDEEQLKQKRASGGLSFNTLVWREGMADWLPYDQVFKTTAGDAGALVAPPLLPEGSPCAECGKVVAAADLVNLKGFRVCSACKPIALQKILEGSSILGSGQEAWQSGKTLIVKSNATLPDCCVKCGQAATTRLPRKLYWHHPALYLLVLISVLVYLIVAMIVRKSGFLVVPLCEAHQARRKRGILISWLLVVLSLVSLTVAIGIDEDEYFVGFAIFLLAGLIVSVVMTRTVVPTKMDAQFIHLKGCCAEFLAKLPAFFP